MDNHIDFVARAEFMRYKDDFVPSKLVFAPTYEKAETLILVPDEASLTSFSHRDVFVNGTFFDLKLFRTEQQRDKGKTYRVDVEHFDEYLTGNFYHDVLREPHGWDVTIGTDDLATFMYLDGKGMPGRIVYLGGTDADVVREAKYRARRGSAWDE